MSDDKTVQPLVSVVIPCFQQQEYLSRALTSLDHQTYDNIEVIVVDDGSELPIVVPNCRYSVQLIRQKNLGLSAARNAGLAAAKGEYIKFLDADDALMAPCIELQVSSLGTAKKTISCVAFNEVTEQTGFTQTLFPAFGEPLSALPFINIGPPHIFLYRTQEVRDIGGFSTAERVAGGHEDYDLIFRMVLDEFNLRTVHQVGAIYYKRPGSMSSKQDKMNKTRALVWLHNTKEAILHGRIGTQEQFVSFLVALPLILKTAPSGLRTEFESICEFFTSILKKGPLSLRKEEIYRLKGLLEEDPLTLPLSQLVEHNDDYSYKEQARPTKFVVNPWFHLKLKESTMPDDELKSVLLNGAKYNGKFIIYGAGELGRRLVRILLAADIKPAFVVDGAWQQLPAIEGIGICSPDKITDANIDLVIIASKGSKKDIESFIKTRRSDIKIL